MHQVKKLIKIINNYPDVWKDYKRFKALLLDFFPEDKVTRNLLLISSEEKIPEEIKNKSILSLQESKALAKRLVSACNCCSDDADRIITMWFETFKACEEKNKGTLRYIDRGLNVEVLELSLRANSILRRNGIICIQDLINKRHELIRVRGMGRKVYEEVADKLQKMGYDMIQYPIQKNSYVINEKQADENINQFLEYLVVARQFNRINNKKMLIHTLEKAALKGYKGDYTAVILGYYYGAFGLEVDHKKAFFYAWKWYGQLERGELAELPAADEILLVMYVVLILLMDGHGKLDDEARYATLNTCIENIIRNGIEIGQDCETENMLLGAVGVACSTGMLHFPDVPTYEIERDVPLGFQALTIASENGTKLATTALLYMFYTEDFITLYRNKEGRAYELFYDLSCRAWEQANDELIEIWQENIFDAIDEDIDFMTLELPDELKLKIKDSGITKYSSFKKNSIVSNYSEFGFDVNDLIRLVATIGQHMEESKSA